MPTRDERRAEAAKHLALVNGVFTKETAAAIESAVIYEDGEGRAIELPEPAFEATKTRATTDFASNTVHRAEGKTLVVDPASFTRPGGGYEDGAFGPEQILCANSNLYPVLRGMKKAYYDANRGYQCGQLFTGRALYLEGIVFTRGGDMKTADVLAIAEPNRQRALENHRSEAECDKVLADRIEAIMHIAAAHEIETLIVGAFGCGREAGDEERTIALFKGWIEAHPGAIANVVFAVPRAHFSAFDAAFGQPKKPVAEQTAPADEAEEDEGFTLDFELPEGITLRS